MQTNYLDIRLSYNTKYSKTSVSQTVPGPTPEFDPAGVFESAEVAAGGPGRGPGRPCQNNLVRGIRANIWRWQGQAFSKQGPDSHKIKIKGAQGSRYPNAINLVWGIRRWRSPEMHKCDKLSLSVFEWMGYFIIEICYLGLDFSSRVRVRGVRLNEGNFACCLYTFAREYLPSSSDGRYSRKTVFEWMNFDCI